MKKFLKLSAIVMAVAFAIGAFAACAGGGSVPGISSGKEVTAANFNTKKTNDYFYNDKGEWTSPKATITAASDVNQGSGKTVKMNQYSTYTMVIDGGKVQIGDMFFEYITADKSWKLYSKHQVTGVWLYTEDADYSFRYMFSMVLGGISEINYVVEKDDDYEAEDILFSMLDFKGGKYVFNLSKYNTKMNEWYSKTENGGTGYKVGVDYHKNTKIDKQASFDADGKVLGFYSYEKDGFTGNYSKSSVNIKYSAATVTLPTGAKDSSTYVPA